MMIHERIIAWVALGGAAALAFPPLLILYATLPVVLYALSKKGLL